MNCEEQIGIEMIEEGIALRDVVTGIRHHLLLAWAVAAPNERFAEIVMPVLFALDRVSLAAHGMGESNTVRSPFSQQKNQKGRRNEAAKTSFRS